MFNFVRFTKEFFQLEEKMRDNTIMTKRDVKIKLMLL